jgi:hypothetical protein
MARRKPIPILTEAQREAIRRGDYPSLKALRGPLEREHDKKAHEQRIAERAEKAGLPINPRPTLLEVAQRPPASEEA